MFEFKLSLQIATDVVHAITYLQDVPLHSVKYSNMHLNFQIAVLQLTIQSNMHLIFAIAVVQLKTLCSNVMNIIQYKNYSISEYNNLKKMKEHFRYMY